MTNKERTENKKPEKKRRKKNGKMVNTNRGEVAYLTGADAILPGQFALLGDRYGLLSVFFFCWVVDSLAKDMVGLLYSCLDDTYDEESVLRIFFSPPGWVCRLISA